MAIKVHGSPVSPAAKRVLLCLAEKQLDYEFVLVDLATGQQKKEPFLSLNPFGQVPGFEDGDLKLFESRAITRYIAHAYADKGTPLISEDPKKMAIIGVWLEVESQRFDAAGQKLSFEILVKPMKGMTTDEAAVEQLQAQLAAVLDVYEVRLAKSKYLGGDDFSLADLHHIPIIANLMKTKVKAVFDARPCVAAWAAALLARPAWLKFYAGLLSATMAVSQPSRSRDLDKLLLRPGHLVGPDFEPGQELRENMKERVKVLVVGAGGLGCELLKDLALTGFRNLDVIDMDRIEVTNLNRQFLFRLEDVGKPKAEVAAKRVMERVNGVNITPHFGRIEDKPKEFYSDFFIIVLGLDSVEARSHINGVACGFLEYDSNDNPREETVIPMVDGGTEGFKGHARIIIPGTTPCFECTIWLFPPQVTFPLCTLAETPRNAAHCIEYAHLIKWNEVHGRKSFDPDNPEDMKWVYSEAVQRAELFGIPGVTYSLTQGVVKNIIPAIASTNAIISAACALETLKIISGCSKSLSNYLTYNGVEGLHIKATEFVKDADCLVCGPGVLIELEKSVTLKKFIDQLEDHPRLLLTRVSVSYGKKRLYMQAPPELEKDTRANLDMPLFDLMNGVSKDIINVNGMEGKGDKKQSCMRKLRIAFKGVDGIADIDMAGGA